MPYLLYQLLKSSAKRYPDKEAVICKSNAITYRQLDILSNRLAWVLRDAGIKKGDNATHCCRDRIGICLKKSIEEIVAIYGILKAGATYVPIEPSDPVQRIAFFIKNCGIKALVTTEKTIANLYKEFPQLSQYLQYAILTDERATEDQEKFSPIKIVTWQQVLQSYPHPLPPPNLIDCDLANITYTSGSTGQPKGVMVTHRSILNFASSFYHCLEIQPGERISHQLPSYFAASVVEIFTSIQAGATIVIVPPELPIFPVELANFIEDQRINIWFSVPSLLIQLILRGNLQQHQFLNLRKILFAGEVFPIQYLRQLMEIIPYVQYCNIYGSAETGARTYYLFKHISPEITSVPIGKACANTELFVVNEQNEIASPGEVGELYARGSSLMKGYWGNHQKTKEVLVPYTVHPLLGEEIVFRTGDLVKQDAEGNYIYIGRRDHTIKSRGYRIELGEIEKVIQNHPVVAEVAVIAIPDDEIGNRLKAFVVAQVGSKLKSSDLQSFCTQYIPKYMIPESVEFRLELPKTSTGKVDRVLLSESELIGKGNT